jgi:hypothetical protein
VRDYSTTPLEIVYCLKDAGVGKWAYSIFMLSDFLKPIEKISRVGTRTGEIIAVSIGKPPDDYAEMVDMGNSGVPRFENSIVKINSHAP